MIYRVERFADCIPEMQPMMAELDSEIALSRPLNVDWAAYKQVEEAGYLTLLTAREHSELLGFAVIAVSPNLHCAGELIALVTSIFVPAKHRTRGVGLGLIRAAEGLQKERGWGELLIASRSAKPLDKILSRRGYQPQETIYSLRRHGSSSTDHFSRD